MFSEGELPSWTLYQSDEAIHYLFFRKVITKKEATRFLIRQGYEENEAADMVSGWEKYDD